VPVLITSTATRKGLKALAATYAQPGRTLAFIGSSGVGKSSLINSLVRDPEAMPTAEVREKDSKGRHTTTRRELVQTPTGALVIDTPGMRELQLWGIEDGVESAFADIAELAAKCRFGNCGHGNEPGCAVRSALAGGSLTAERFASYQKLKTEKLASVPARRKPSALASKPGWKTKSEGKTPFRHRQHVEE
jgi:ribosome biogenesis GTPase